MATWRESRLIALKSTGSSRSARAWSKPSARPATSSSPPTSRGTRPAASTGPGLQVRSKGHVAERGVVLSLDEGTTGATTAVVGLDGEIRAKGYREITQHYPQPGWVEHDELEIWSAVQLATQEALQSAGATPADVQAVGITNQRETLAVWGRRTLEPLAPAIVWQDRRTAAVCDQLREAGHGPRVREVTGLVLDPYFTATKLAWAIEHVAGGANAAVGTVDSWLVARLSAGRDHVTDASNALRPLLLDIARGVWSEEMAGLFDVPITNLPRVVDSTGQISTTD